MKEKDEGYAPILEPSDPDEQPEEGFIPYCGSEEAAQTEKRLFSVRHIPFFIAGVLALLVLLNLIGRPFNFYHNMLDGLRFDYTEGEIMDEEPMQKHSSISRSIAETIGNKPVHINACLYVMDEKFQVDSIISEYDYQHETGMDTLISRSGSSGSFFTKTVTYRRDGSGTKKKSGSDWKADPNAFVPNLYEFFFGTEDHGAYEFSLYEIHGADVKGMRYTCEIWLMSQTVGSEMLYYTLYRYFDGNQLAGVRVLCDIDTTIEIYDVKSYSFG